MVQRISADAIGAVLSSALRVDGLIEENDTTLIFTDLSHLTERIQNLMTRFPPSALHAIAIKANPLAKILERITGWGTGLEAATLPELLLAERTGIAPQRIVFDSPAKTRTELEYALRLGCHINADSFAELDRIAKFLDQDGLKSSSTIGLRINPQVGAGSIDSTSVATEYSKFGVPLAEYRQELIIRLKKHAWLTGVHLHIGSQGCSIDLLLEGIARIFSLTTQVNQQLAATNDHHRINIFDIGGGLPVSYTKDPSPVSLSHYAAEIRSRFPELFTDKYKLVTEFGRFIHANSGWVASRVEYVKKQGDRHTVIIHVGADLFLRKCYRPTDWRHDILVASPDGHIKMGAPKNLYTIAGPLCFAGDTLASEVELPVINEGDFIIIRDTGAYTLSMWSRYNSRQVPKVLAYSANNGEFEIFKDKESLEKVAEFWI